MLQEFQQHIQKNFSFLKEKKLLIAVSGGIDSVVLCDLLNKSQYSFSIAHCNFRLRGSESDKDEEFVKNLAKKIPQECFVKHFDTEVYANKKNISIQMAARDLRYEWFDELIQKKHFDYLLTAHHADDDLETFLINFTRGTGLEGLTGIPAINDKKIRPLLPFSRNEIIIYAKEQNLKWREDKTNAEIKYFRNKLRHEVIPVLKQLNPNLLTSFLQTIENLKGTKSIVFDRINKVEKEIKYINKEKVTQLDIHKIKSLNNPKAYLYEILKDYKFTEWDDIYDLLSAQSGKQIFSKNHRLVKDRDHLLLSEISNQIDDPELFKISDKQKDIVFNGLKIKIEEINNEVFKKEEYLINDTNHIIFVDKDKLQFPLTVRKWEKGDYFYPFGMPGKKKLSKYFKDEKFSVLEKENIWLLCSLKEIIWVINYRLDNRYKITDDTKTILKFEIEK
ncbi:MAG: tRNA lysidine(34) synthetase TilS [Bacteroidota bacterium]